MKAGKFTEIIIADPNPQIVKANRHILEAQGFKVRVATGGLEVLSLILELKPEYLLVDRYCEELDGIELAVLLSNRSETRSIKIILSCQEPGGYEHLKAEMTGLHSMLLKPYGKADLLNSIKRDDGLSSSSDTANNLLESC